MENRYLKVRDKKFYLLDELQLNHKYKVMVYNDKFKIWLFVCHAESKKEAKEKLIKRYENELDPWGIF